MPLNEDDELLIFIYHQFNHVVFPVPPLGAQELAKYGETMAGTGSATTNAALKHAKGNALNANTIPAVTTPFAMTQWTPQTQTSENKCTPPYFYKTKPPTNSTYRHLILKNILLSLQCFIN